MGMSNKQIQDSSSILFQTTTTRQQRQSNFTRSTYLTTTYHNAKEKCQTQAETRQESNLDHTLRLDNTRACTGLETINEVNEHSW